jgi:hypothetical protein
VPAVTAEAMTAAVDDRAGLDARRRPPAVAPPESEPRSNSTAAPPELPVRGLTGVDRRATPRRLVVSDGLRQRPNRRCRAFCTASQSYPPSPHRRSALSGEAAKSSSGPDECRMWHRSRQIGLSRAAPESAIGAEFARSCRLSRSAWTEHPLGAHTGRTESRRRSDHDPHIAASPRCRVTPLPGVAD